MGLHFKLGGGRYARGGGGGGEPIEITNGDIRVDIRVVFAL